EDGVLLAEGQRFRRDSQLVVTEVDTERLQIERMRLTSFADAVHGARRTFRRIPLQPIPAPQPRRLERAVDPHPFVPSDPSHLDERCEEIFAIQSAGLAKRLEHTGIRRVTLGLSGGLDSTLALLVCVRTFDLLGLERKDVIAVTMPGFGTTGQSLASARALAAALRASLREIDIRAACAQHIKDIGLPESDRSVTYQNLQARERTQ